MLPPGWAETRRAVAACCSLAGLDPSMLHAALRHEAKHMSPPHPPPLATHLSHHHRRFAVAPKVLHLLILLVVVPPQQPRTRAHCQAQAHVRHGLWARQNREGWLV